MQLSFKFAHIAVLLAAMTINAIADPVGGEPDQLHIKRDWNDATGLQERSTLSSSAGPQGNNEGTSAIYMYPRSVERNMDLEPRFYGSPYYRGGTPGGSGGARGPPRTASTNTERPVIGVPDLKTRFYGSPYYRGGTPGGPGGARGSGIQRPGTIDDRLSSANENPNNIANNHRRAGQIQRKEMIPRAQFIHVSR
ncbi:unnamed protein product [Sympodiomycopsis kandeliae]